MNVQKEETVKLPLGDVYVLDYCVNIETKCAELYRFFGELYADIPEISSLWDKTAKEEDNHAEQFKLAVRLKGTGMEGVKSDLSRVMDIVDTLDTYLAKFKESNPTPVQALTFAIQLEEDLSEYHMASIIDFADNEQAKLFTCMADNDNGHVELLQKALKKLTKG